MAGENEGGKGEEGMLPGFRFHPTDEELVGFYLRRKVQKRAVAIELIRQLDIYKYDPWDLPKLAMAGEKEWYFYCPRDRKYRNSARPNRVTGAGFWKATGTDRPIYAAADAPAACIGLKKSLVFYTGRAAKGVKTDWMMHEYRLPPSSPFKTSAREISPSDSWAICRIFKKTSSGSQRSFPLSWASLPPVESVEPPPFSFSSMEMEPLAFSSAGAELPPAAESPPRFSLDVAALLQWMQPQFADGPFPSPSPSPSSLVGLRHPPKEKKEGAVFEENGTLGAAVLPFAPPQSLL